jgi:transposase
MSAVAVESGKHRSACFRRACDKRLRNAVATLADSTRHRHPWAHDIYTRARARGCDHPHAIRILGRAWLRVIWRIWQDRTTYDPTRHGNLQQLLANKG